MHPAIFQIGPFTVYSFGILLAVAIVVATVGLSRDARSLGIAREKIYDFIFWTVLAGIAGARLFYIILNFGYFVDHPSELIMVQKGGLAWQGSLIMGSIVGIFYIRKNKWPLGKFLDLVAPYAALGQAIGRIGCFFNGCCYGKVCATGGLYFPVHDAVLYPTQLYDSFGLFIIFLVLKRYQKFLKIDGQVFLLYLALAASLRFVVEFFRADHNALWLQLSIFQWICLVIIAVAWYAHTHLQSRSRK